MAREMPMECSRLSENFKRIRQFSPMFSKTDGLNQKSPFKPNSWILSQFLRLSIESSDKFYQFMRLIMLSLLQTLVKASIHEYFKLGMEFKETFSSIV